MTGSSQGGGVLTIHQDYFVLKGGIERWLYRVARKHAGSQDGGWRFTMKQLHEKSGSMSRLANFACDIRKAVSANALPEYGLEIIQESRGRGGCTHGPTGPDRALTRFIRCRWTAEHRNMVYFVDRHGLSEVRGTAYQKCLSRFNRCRSTAYQMLNYFKIMM